MKTFKELFNEARKSNVYQQELLILEFIETLRKRLEELGWNRKDLAKKMGVTQGCVSQWFKGPNLRLSTMVRLSMAVGLRLAFKFEPIDEKNS